MQEKPELRKHIPLLLAIRQKNVFASDEEYQLQLDFANDETSIKDYAIFLDKTGIFNLLANKNISNIVDYAIGIEVGLAINVRSYKMIAEEVKDISNEAFIWITDGQGWYSAKNNLEETFNILPHLYNIQDLEDGILLNL